MLTSPLKPLPLLLQRKKHIGKNLQHLFKLKDFFHEPPTGKIKSIQHFHLCSLPLNDFAAFYFKSQDTFKKAFLSNE